MTQQFKTVEELADWLVFVRMGRDKSALKIRVSKETLRPLCYNPKAVDSNQTGYLFGVYVEIDDTVEGFVVENKTK